MRGGGGLPVAYALVLFASIIWAKKSPKVIFRMVNVTISHAAVGTLGLQLSSELAVVVVDTSKQPRVAVGDRLIEVNGNSVQGMSMDDAASISTEEKNSCG